MSSETKSNEAFGKSWDLLDFSEALWNRRHSKRFDISETLSTVMGSGKKGERSVKPAPGSDLLACPPSGSPGIAGG